MAALATLAVTVPLAESSGVRSCGGPVNGTKLSVSRPTYLQVSSRNAPLVVMFHGMNSCVAYLQRQTGLRPDGVNILWVGGAPSSPGATARNWDTWSSSALRRETYVYLDSAIAAARRAGATGDTVIAAGISQGAYAAVAAVCARVGIGGGRTWDGAQRFDGVFSVVGTAHVYCPRRTNVSAMFVGTMNDVIGDDRLNGYQKLTSMRDQWLRDQVSCSKTRVVKTSAISRWSHACSGGRVLEAVVVSRLGHVWPATAAFSANRELVAFATCIHPRITTQWRNP